MPRAKTQTAKKSTKVVEKKQEQKQINIDELIAHIRAEVKKEIVDEFEEKIKLAESRVSKGLDQRRDKITLTGESQYVMKTD